MFEVLGLETRVVNIASVAGAGDKTAILQPSDGEIWIVVEALGYNDEGAIQSRWSYTDGTLTIILDPALAVATTDRISCYSKSPNSANAHSTARLPFVLNSAASLTWTSFSLAAGKKGYVDAIVQVLRGVPLQ